MNDDTTQPQPQPTPDWYVATTNTLARAQAEADGNQHMTRNRCLNISAAVHLVKEGDIIKATREPSDNSALWDLLTHKGATIQ